MNFRFGFLKHIIWLFSKFLLTIGYFGQVISPIVVCSILQNTISSLTFVASVLISAVIGFRLKKLIAQPRPRKSLPFLADERDSLQRVAFGMPSGHAMIVILSIGYLYLMKGSFNSTGMIILYLVAGLTFVERYLYLSHTISQLFAGGLLGLLLSYPAYRFTKYVQEKKEKKK